jgi:NADH:ubiquinone oxidoreductase subunit 4 (subunit M)
MDNVGDGPSKTVMLIMMMMMTMAPAPLPRLEGFCGRFFQIRYGAGTYQRSCSLLMKNPFCKTHGGLPNFY